MGKLIDLTGQRFGRLVVVERAGSTQRGQATWLCRCDCGNETAVVANSLRRGNTNSCGCIHSELLSSRNYKHGKRHSRLYGVWLGMKERCYNPKHNRYHRYGGRGIAVCDEWRDNFNAFYEWSVANGYDENAPYGECTIDRIDVDSDYCPENCRWVDLLTQRNNRSEIRKEARQ